MRVSKIFFLTSVCQCMSIVMPRVMLTSVVTTICILLHVCNGSSLFEEFYSLSAVDVNGNVVSFETLRNKAVLIINTNTHSNYSEENLAMLIRVEDVLEAMYRDDKFAALVFPSGQFTPVDSNEAQNTQDYMRKYFQPDYRVFRIVDVIGDNAHPVYKNIIAQSGIEPDADFWKYIVNHEGKVVRIFKPHIDLREVVYGCKDATKAAVEDNHKWTKSSTVEL